MFTQARSGNPDGAFAFVASQDSRLGEEKLGFIRQRSEVGGRMAMPGSSFERRGDAKEQGFIERTRNEVDAHRQGGGDWAHQASTPVGVAFAIPDLRRKSPRHGDYWEALLAEQ